jgi:hypothetical protein
VARGDQPPHQVDVLPRSQRCVEGGQPAAYDQRRARHVGHRRARPDGHIVGPEVERRPAREIAAEQARPDDRTDAGRDRRHQRVGEVGEQRVEPAGRDDDVAVDAGDHVAAGGRDPGVARGGGAGVRLPDHPDVRAIDRDRDGAAVVDHDHRVAVAEPVEARREVAVAHGHDHRDRRAPSCRRVRPGEPGVDQPPPERTRRVGGGRLAGEKRVRQHRPARGQPQQTARHAARDGIGVPPDPGRSEHSAGDQRRPRQSDSPPSTFSSAPVTAAASGDSR